jgi:Relaxase/Mobilisation nuclease domain.
MATTRLITHHISKGETIAESLADRFDYGQNPDKTQNGELIAAYMCDPETADAEFLLSKAQYKAITGREQKKDMDILCYQSRQSFLPGEVDAETALKIGYDTAMRWTKGKYAFFVATHVDRHHIHNHIYYNSTSLDCTKKFRNFWNSTFALRRLSDRICLENNLSYIKNPKPHSKGKYKHYGQWQGDNRPQTWQEKLKAQIDSCLAKKPPDMAAFLQAMAAAGYEVRHGRGGVLSFRAPEQERFTRLRSSTLGAGYGQEDIQAIIEGCSPLSEGRAGSPRKVNLIIDIQSRMRAGKGPAYERWAKVFNLKMMAQTLQYLQENNLLEYEQLAEKAAQSTDRFHALSDKIKTLEAAMNTNAELKAAIIDYAKTRAVFDGYKAVKYSRKYYAEHEADIEIHRAARATFQRALSGTKLPKMDALKAEWQKLSAEKKTTYKEYRDVKRNMQEVVTAKANIDHLLGLTDTQKNKEMER